MMFNPNPAPVIHPLPSDVFSAMHVLDLSIIQYLLNIYRYMASTYAYQLSAPTHSHRLLNAR